MVGDWFCLLGAVCGLVGWLVCCLFVIGCGVWGGGWCGWLVSCLLVVSILLSCLLLLLISYCLLAIALLLLLNVYC